MHQPPRLLRPLHQVPLLALLRLPGPWQIPLSSPAMLPFPRIRPCPGHYWNASAYAGAKTLTASAMPSTATSGSNLLLPALSAPAAITLQANLLPQSNALPPKASPLVQTSQPSLLSRPVPFPSPASLYPRDLLMATSLTHVEPFSPTRPLGKGDDSTDDDKAKKKHLKPDQGEVHVRKICVCNFNLNFSQNIMISFIRKVKLFSI